MTLLKNTIAGLILAFSASHAFANSELLNHGNNRGPEDEFEINSPYVSLHCTSTNYSYRNCPVNGRIARVYLVQQQSNSVCIEGRSWGYDYNSVWVDHGCEADFRVELIGGTNYPPPHHPPPHYPPPHNPPPHYPPPHYPPPHNPPPHYPPPAYDEFIDCESVSYRYRECVSPGRQFVRDARLIRQRSDSECVRGYSWGVTNRGVWVDRGCRGEFKLFY